MDQTDDLVFDNLPGAIPSNEVRALFIPEYQEESPEPEESAGFGELTGLVRDDVHVVNNVIRAKSKEHKYDQDFIDSMTLESMQKDLEVNGLDDSYLELFSEVTNAQEYNRMLYRATEIQNLNQELDKAGGWKAFGAQMAAYATDPVGFAVDAAAGGSTKVKLLHRFLESGGRAAAADMLTEVMRTTDGEPVNLSELAFGTLTSFGIGGVMGLPGSKAARIEAEDAAQIEVLKNSLVEATAEDEVEYIFNNSINAYRPEITADDSVSKILAESIDPKDTVDGTVEGNIQKLLEGSLNASTAEMDVEDLLNSSLDPRRVSSSNIDDEIQRVEDILETSLNATRKTDSNEVSDILEASVEGDIVNTPPLKHKKGQIRQITKPAISESSLNDGSAGAAANPDFPKKSIGELDDSDLLSDVRGKIAEEGGLPTSTSTAGKAQLSHAAWAQKSNSEVVKKLSADVHGVGIEDVGGVRQIPMEMDSGRLKEQFISPWYESVNENYATWLKETKGKGFFRRQASHEDFDEFMEMVGDYRLGKIDNVPEQVKKVAEADRAFYAGFKEEGIRSGAFDPARFSNDSNWMSRVISRDKLYGMMNKAGVRSHTQFKPLVANAIKRGRQAAGLEVDDRLTDVVASAYLNRAWAQGEGGLNIKQSGDLDLTDLDSIRELIEEFIPDSEKAGALEILKNSTVSKLGKEGGEIDTMKTRLLLDQNATMDINGQTFSMADLYENNVAKLSNGYANKMSAELAFRGRGYSTKKFEKVIAELEKEANVNKNYKQQHGNWEPGKATPQDVANLQFSLDRMTHKGIRSDNETLDTLLRISGNQTYASKMGSAGLNAITETGTLLAFRGLTGFVKDIPTIRKLAKSYRKGNVDDVYVAQIEALTSGAGSKLAESRASFKIEDDVTSSMRGFTGKLEKATDVGKRLANETNLLSHITDLSTRYSTATVLSRLDQWASGKKMPGWWANRSKSWGLGDGRDTLIKEWLTGSNVKRGKGGGIVDIGLDKMDYDTEKAFRQFIHRVNSNNIQKVFSGDLPRMMQTPFGAFIMKFRSFTTAAWGKHTLDDLNHFDGLAAQKLMMTAGLGMFMYMNRTYISHPFDEKKREELLTMDNALRSGATYAVNVSILPAIVDNISELANGEPLIGKKRTSGLSTGFSPKNFASNIPGVAMLDDMVKALSAPGKLATTGNITKEQVKAISSILMLDTFYGTRGLRAAAVDAAPSERETDKVDYLKELKEIFD